MSQRTTMVWSRVARAGATVGLMIAGAYALAFLGYAITRATATLLLTPSIDGGLTGTIAVTALSLAVPVAVFATLCAPLAAGLGAATALLIRTLLARMPMVYGRLGAALLGVGMCVALGLVLIGMLARGLGLVWNSGTAEALTFWLVLPLVLYTLAGALGSSQLQQAFSD